MPKTTKATKTRTVIEAYSESKMAFFKKIENGWKPLTISAKCSILDAWLMGSEFASAIMGILTIKFLNKFLTI